MRSIELLSLIHIFEENEEESKESEFWNDLYENEYNTINPVVCIGSRISDTDNYIFVNHNARDMLQGLSLIHI